MYLQIFLAATFFGSLVSGTQVSDKQACLTLEEQKQFGKILINLDSAIADNPNCVNGWGAAGCLDPYEKTLKNYFEKKLKDCSKN